MTLRLSDIHTHPEKTGNVARIAAYIAARGIGVVVTKEELFELCWGRRSDGGPDHPTNSINVCISILRKELRPEWKIRAEHSVGYELVRQPVPQMQERAA